MCMYEIVLINILVLQLNPQTKISDSAVDLSQTKIQVRQIS